MGRALQEEIRHADLQVALVNVAIGFPLKQSAALARPTPTGRDRCRRRDVSEAFDRKMRVAWHDSWGRPYTTFRDETPLE